MLGAALSWVTANLSIGTVVGVATILSAVASVYFGWQRNRREQLRQQWEDDKHKRYAAMLKLHDLTDHKAPLAETPVVLPAEKPKDGGEGH